MRNCFTTARRAVPLLLLTAIVSWCAAPTNNPVAEKYGADAYAWTNSIRWNAVFNVNDYSGTATEKFTKARDAAAAAGGGVVFFPAGTYTFEDNISLKNGVVLRGETPTNTDARSNTYALASKLVFPKYNPVFSGTGTPNSTAFKKILVEDPDRASNFGLVYLDINRAAISLQGHPDNGRNKNIVVMGIRSNNVAEAASDVPATGQEAWQRFSYRFGANLRVHAYANALVANNRFNDNTTDNFTMTGYKLTDGTTTTVTFSYTDHYVMMVNRNHDNTRNTWNVDFVDQPSVFRAGVVVRDNWCYHTMRVALYAGGYGLIVKDNVVKDSSGKNAPVDPTGQKVAKGHMTFENRAIDVTGWDVTVEGNTYEVYSHRTPDGYGTTDGEGILLQECCAGSRINGLVIRGNRGNNYIGLYKTPTISDVLIKGNILTGNSAQLGNVLIYVSADKNGNATDSGYRPMYHVRIEDNDVMGSIMSRATRGGTGNTITNNTGHGGVIRYSSHVTVSSNPNFTLERLNSADTTIPPRIVLTSPHHNSQTSSPVRITAQVTKGTAEIDKVDFYQDRALLGTKSSAPYTLDWTPPANGDYYVTARVTDRNGQWTTAKPAFASVGQGGGTFAAGGFPRNTPSNYVRITSAGRLIAHVQSPERLLIEVFSLSGRKMAGRTVRLEPGVHSIDLYSRDNGPSYGAPVIVRTRIGKDRSAAHCTSVPGR